MNHFSARQSAARIFIAIGVAAAAATVASAGGAVHRIGSVTWHPDQYAGQVLDLVGYPLARRDGYVLFSDEAQGAVSAHDLPVAGANVDKMQLHRRYYIQGKFVGGGLKASNGNPYHLQLTALPKLAPR
ncbi:hypothetical protein [Mesorhizobium sp. ES1-4]|uniref:hypothetical protein n=1 Tax=Mesorhizobium sp. ES1-4 TaxID=2876627 RepID=UPI001CCC87B8|nr:hypothetical protein [Mesorhizobium sp. ES1-4]MBZ9799596.1 hypothetical protein [Mesorhizobium sp. ES1-4]